MTGRSDGNQEDGSTLLQLQTMKIANPKRKGSATHAVSMWDPGSTLSFITCRQTLNQADPSESGFTEADKVNNSEKPAEAIIQTLFKETDGETLTMQSSESEHETVVSDDVKEASAEPEVIVKTPITGRRSTRKSMGAVEDMSTPMQNMS